MNSTNHRSSKNGMPFSSSFFPPGVQQAQCGKNISSLLLFQHCLGVQISRDTIHYCLTLYIRSRRSRCPAPNALQLVLSGQLPLHSFQSHLLGLQALKSSWGWGCLVESHPTNYFCEKVSHARLFSHWQRLRYELPQHLTVILGGQYAMQFFLTFFGGCTWQLLHLSLDGTAWLCSGIHSISVFSSG